MQHVNVKLFAVEPAPADLSGAIPVFHRWIQRREFPELLIDIADYGHVPDGPGVMLIAHEANYSLDRSRGRLGVLYDRKATLDGTPSENLRQAYEAALAAARRLEEEPEFQGILKVGLDEVEVILNDRLLFPNSAETWEAVRPDVEGFFDELFSPGTYSVRRASDPRERFRILVTRDR
jgi:hypothetical protein